MKESGSPPRHPGNSSKRCVPKPSKTGENRLRPEYSGHIFEGQVPPVPKRASSPISEEDRSRSRTRTLLSVVLILLVVAGAINGALFSGLAGDCDNGGDTSGGCMPGGADSKSDCSPSISCTMSNRVNIVDRMESKGLTWKAWAEDLPSSNPCTGTDAYPGFSTVRHFPF